MDEPLARLKPADFDDRMTLVDHLDELRTRIVWSLVFLVVASGICFAFNDQLLEIANEPLPGDRVPITFGITEPFFQTTKLAIYGGILISLPFLLYQAYAFLLPAFAPGERKVDRPVPDHGPDPVHRRRRLRLLRRRPGGGQVPPQLQRRTTSTSRSGPASTTASSSRRVMSVGILFQIPVGILAVTRLGIVTPKQLSKNRRYAILALRRRSRCCCPAPTR